MAWITGTGLLVATALTACGGDSTFDIPADERIVFHFKMRGDTTGVQDFRAATADAQVIAMVREELQRPEVERRLHINGRIARDNGGINLNWNWHFVDDAWTLAGVSIELCDGNAVLVSQAVDYWVDTVGSFCPWGSFVAFEVNR